MEVAGSAGERFWVCVCVCVCVSCLSIVSWLGLPSLVFAVAFLTCSDESQDSRRYFFWRVKRRVLQDHLIARLQKANTKLSHKERMSMMQQGRMFQRSPLVCGLATVLRLRLHCALSPRVAMCHLMRSWQAECAMREGLEPSI